MKTKTWMFAGLIMVLAGGTALADADEVKDHSDLEKLWSYGLISRRTGEPLVKEDGEHRMDRSKVSYGYNVVVDKNGNVLRPSARPLQGGE